MPTDVGQQASIFSRLVGVIVVFIGVSDFVDFFHLLASVVSCLKKLFSSVVSGALSESLITGLLYIILRDTDRAWD